MLHSSKDTCQRLLTRHYSALFPCLVLLIVVLLVSACGDDCDGLCLTEQEKTLILLQAIVGLSDACERATGTSAQILSESVSSSTFGNHQCFAITTTAARTVMVTTSGTTTAQINSYNYSIAQVESDDPSTTIPSALSNVRFSINPGGGTYTVLVN